jgi:DegV family protein with EDD domain
VAGLATEIAIVTDSTADLPRNLLDEYDIHTVPLGVHVGDKTYLDGVELTAKEFYPMLIAARDLPKTSQPPPGVFEDLYQRLVASGKEVISIHLSGKLSGTVRSAAMAAENLKSKLALPQGAIRVFDSLNATMGLGWQVLAAAEASRLGKTAAEIFEMLEKARDRVQLFVALDTLEYIHKGGRIGALTAFLGTLLNFKPILQVVEGAPIPFARLRSQGQVVRKFVELVGEHLQEALKSGVKLRIAIVHGHAAEEAAALRDELIRCLNCEIPILVETGPVLGIHTGPGALGVALY